MDKIFVVFFLLSLCHCGGSGDAAAPGTQSQALFKGSCNAVAAQGLCLEHYYDDNRDLKTSCSNTLGASFSESNPCPSSPKVGTCKMGSTETRYTLFIYYSPKFSAAAVQNDCANLNGEFIP